MIRKHEFLHKAGSIALLLIAAILWIPLYLARLRFVRVSAFERIGHLALEPDVFIKEQALGMSKRCKGVIVRTFSIAANECLLEYWGREFRIVNSPILRVMLARVNRLPYIGYDVRQVAINQTAPHIAVQKAWGSRPAVLALTEKHRRKGMEGLEELGVPRDAEFICFHCREGNYSPSDEESHSFRNCSVENYLPAVSELARFGYWCIRMGDPSMRQIPKLERVIDYAHLRARSDWMDVFLCATCKCFLGCASGLVFLPYVFGKSSGSANHATLSTVLAFSRNDVAIPKLLWSEDRQRYLSFPEIFRSDVANFRFTALFKENRIRPIENTADDVRALALEMLERSRGLAAYTPEDEELQERFKALMRPGHYSYGGINRIGRDFLRKYAYLLEDR
ncbi:MAG: TIGR04372 family glycosyltransferase [Acidobacteria bacterium]|nr:TIGR04372 family glycosyltransferase [Acidobacteriota bacterium]